MLPGLLVTDPAYGYSLGIIINKAPVDSQMCQFKLVNFPSPICVMHPTKQHTERECSGPVFMFSRVVMSPLPRPGPHGADEGTTAMQRRRSSSVLHPGDCGQEQLTKEVPAPQL